jgi:uncharacterized membrane protein YozB (DUF420 family)
VQTRVQKEGIRQQIYFPIFILHISQCIIHHQDNYLLILTAVTERRVEKIKFHKINNNCN